uniref:secretoglobin family 1D member 2-like n=1 Tax=Myodes glareolus TaxID=447135 RepID=UPI002020B1AB|nr:secretoglobin family 1D member 2-like [Myodes glareolus]
MRLFLCLLLVVLAVCCYEANAAPVCLAVKRACSTFLLFSEKALKKELGRYDAPPEAVEAKLQVKRCVDSKLSYVERVSVAGVLDNMNMLQKVQVTETLPIMGDQKKRKNSSKNVIQSPVTLFKKHTNTPA